MKKNNLLFLLSLLTLCSCGETPISTSSSISSSESSQSTSISSIDSTITDSSSSTISSSESSSSSEESFIDESYADSKEVKAIKALFEDNDIVDRSIKKVNNVFKDSTYTYDGTIMSTYPDDYNTKLTDGITTELFNKEDWVGISDHNDDSVTFDVSKASACVGEINVHMLQIQSYAIFYPYSVRLEVSLDNNKYYKVGEVYTPDDISENSDFNYRFAFDNYCGASYYRVTFVRNENLKYGAKFFFIDEITAYEYSEDGEIELEKNDDNVTDFYNYSINTETTTTKVSSSDSDYNTHQNLALLPGVDVDIKHFAKMERKLANENSPIEKSSILHDGKTTTSLSGDEFFKFAYGSGREVVFDLGNVMAVDSVSIDALSKFNSNIQVFNAYSVELSVDGKNYVSVGGEFTNMLMNKVNKVYNYVCNFKDCYKARYVKISFINDTNLDYLPDNVWISEISIMGYKNATNKQEAVYDKSIINGNYPNPEDFGVENILFAPLKEQYHFKDTNALPYLAFLSESGEILDYFFDATALSCTQIYTSEDRKENVKEQADFMMKTNENYGSLNKVMGQVNKALGQSKKLKVFLTLDSFETSDTCSDVDSDGKAEDLSDVNDLTDYLLYEVKYLTSRFNAMNYENLELAGFYFCKEYMNETKLDVTTPALKTVNDYIRSKNQLSLWCPFNGVDTIGCWNPAGFDIACYQPNYMFNEVGIERLDSTALEAKINGMCVEIEIESVNNAALNDRYYDYLNYSIKYGHNTSVKMYYQGAIPGGYYHASTENYELYEITYKYAKNTLELNFNEKEKIDLSKYNDIDEVVVHDNSTSFSIGDGSKVDIKIKQSFRYGDVKIDLSGDITYFAKYGYQGYDYMILTLTDTYGNSKDITVTLKVTKE